MQSVAKKPTPEQKLYKKLEEEIINGIIDPDIKRMRMVILSAIGAKNYKSWFHDKPIYLRSGWYVIPVANEWSKNHLKKLYNNMLNKNKIILQVGD